MSSITGISSLPTMAPASSTPSGNLTQQRISDLVAIGTALQNGDLAGAQQAFGALMQITSFVNPNGKLAQEVNALGSALQSGNLTSAQQALTNLGNLIVGFVEKQAGATGLTPNQSTIVSELEGIAGVSASASSSPTTSNASATGASPGLNVIA
ncbi:MAG TPA: hypothetical protein VFB15_11275 [Candidatus Binataceae bacterium]|nr:hypothetical protein [Candidatus Binataceae bacterium]